jgi:hypothetical protein
MAFAVEARVGNTSTVSDLSDATDFGVILSLTIVGAEISATLVALLMVEAGRGLRVTRGDLPLLGGLAADLRVGFCAPEAVVPVVRSVKRRFDVELGALLADLLRGNLVGCVSPCTCGEALCLWSFVTKKPMMTIAPSTMKNKSYMPYAHSKEQVVIAVKNQSESSRPENVNLMSNSGRDLKDKESTVAAGHPMIS